MPIFLTDKKRLERAERENKKLRECVEELTDALIEVAEIAAEGEQKNG